MAGVMVVFGTRPEAIKLLPVARALRLRGVNVRVCVTGQHRELLDHILDPETFRPDIDLGLMQPGQFLPELMASMTEALARVFRHEAPDRVIVQGDTATAAAAAHAAFLTQIPVAHVEAGLRTDDLHSPFPEEGNRRLISIFADLHFAPTAHARTCLLREGIGDDRIYVTGNTIVDALQGVTRSIDGHPPPSQVRAVLARAAGKRLIVVTCHRRENAAKIDSVSRALLELARRPDVLLAVPIHPNPAVRVPLHTALSGQENIILLDPLQFRPFVALLSAAYMVLTDSGGVQEEAPVLGVPVLILRDTTERPEGVEAGTAMLVGTGSERIVAEASRLLDSPFAHARMAREHSPYGDGRAAERIADVIAAELLGEAVAVASA